MQSPIITIAKDFHWEMGHRLPFHTGGCQNIHGHSYSMRVELEGTANEYGMVMDYNDLRDIVSPLVARLDHSFICDENDEAMVQFFREHPMKTVVVPFHTTAENLAVYMLEEIVRELAGAPNILRIRVRLHETQRTFAEAGRELRLPDLI